MARALRFPEACPIAPSTSVRRSVPTRAVISMRIRRLGTSSAGASTGGRVPAFAGSSATVVHTAAAPSAARPSRPPTGCEGPSSWSPSPSACFSGSGYRQIARFLGCSPTTVMTHAARLGRHCMLYLEAHRPGARPREPIVVDGFESFAFSQYYPLHLNLAVGAESHFVYGLTESELRRKGSHAPGPEGEAGPGGAGRGPARPARHRERDADAARGRGASRERGRMCCRTSTEPIRGRSGASRIAGRRTP